MHSASSFYRARQRPARGARLRRGYCRAKRGGRAARATEGASLSVARSAAGVSRGLCPGETPEARLTAGNSPRVAVRRGTRGTAMALWSHQMPLERRSPPSGPLTMPATRKRLYEGGEGLGGEGPPSAPRRPRGFGGEQPPTARRARPGGRSSRGPGPGRGRPALLGQRYARPQAAKKITRKFLVDHLKFKHCSSLTGGQIFCSHKNVLPSRSYLPYVIESFISDNVALEHGRDVRHDGTARKSKMVLAIDQLNVGSGPVFRFIFLIRFPSPLPDGPARVLNLTKGVYG